MKKYGIDYLNTVQKILESTKIRSYQILNAQPNYVIADIGCGVGVDVFNLAESGAQLYGIDNDQNFLKTAQDQISDNTKIRFIYGSAEDIPLENGSVDICRFDRVFQHISDYAQALNEVNRILKAHGLLQIVDLDYLSISTFLDDEVLERKIIDTFAYQRITSGYKIRRLPQILQENHFSIVSIEICPHIITSYQSVSSLFFFDSVVEELLQQEKISLMDYETWQRHKEGNFNCSINLILFLAQKNR